MKNLKITVLLIIAVITSTYAQEQKKVNFLLAPKTVEVYDFKEQTVATNGTHFTYEFEDDYTVKLTNKMYKIQLFFEDAKSIDAQKAVAKFLDGTDTKMGYKKMVWKKTNQNGNQMYKIELKDKKLKIEIFRAYMDANAYAMLSNLGKKFIEVTNS